ncbi:MAG: hypothetical protein Q8862_00925 [Bacteroidota bacterium]|nr:hypothetical protein [Bacteroidota bacterium]
MKNCINKFRFFLILSSILLISCSSKSNKSIANDEAKIQNETTISEEPFDVFIKKFSKDSSFQLLRIKFPLVYNYSEEEIETGSLQTKQIKKEEWKIIDLVDKSGFGEPVEIIKETNGSDLIQLLVKGVETGIYIVYFFEKEDNKWCLVKITDQSN